MYTILESVKMKYSYLLVVYIVFNVILRPGGTEAASTVPEKEETLTERAIVDDVFAISVSNPCQAGHIRLGTSCIRLYGISE